MFRHIFSFVALIAVLSFVACEGGWVYECPEYDACPTCMTDQYCNTNDVIEDVSMVDVPMVDVGKDIPNDVAQDVGKDDCPWCCPADFGCQTDVGGQDWGQDDSMIDVGVSECQISDDCYQYINGNPSCIMAGCQRNNDVGKCYFYERENFSPCGGSYYCYDGECIPSNCDDFNNCTVDFLNENNNCVHEVIDNCCNTRDDCDDGNHCTGDDCVEGRCSFQNIHGARCCDDSSDCAVYNTPCQTNFCLANRCHANPPKPYCLPCTENEDCLGYSRCRGDGQLVYEATGNCVNNECEVKEKMCENGCRLDTLENGTFVQYCINSDCNDGNMCTKGFLDENNNCIHEVIEGCCKTNDDCNVGLGCQAFSCENNECVFDPAKNCMPPQTPCESDDDCVGKPYGPYCVYSEIDQQSYCVKCFLDVKNNVNVGCEEDRPLCYWGIGTDVNQTNFSQYWCAQCVHEGDCNDGNACTKDICDYTDADWARGVGAICRHEMMDGCQACQTVVDCEDSNPCTIDNCVAGKCNFEVIESCCTADEDCALMVDGDCENFACVENACECLDNNNPLIQCEIACPTKYPYAVVWYASRTTYLENKPAVFEQFMDELCTWAPDFPIFEFNCTNAVDIWADGNTAVVKCNYPFVNNPHPVEGDYGKRVISFPSLDCSP